MGAVKCLREEFGRHEWRRIFGTSTGSLIAAMEGAALAFEDDTFRVDLHHIYTNVFEADIFKPVNSLAYKLAGEMGLLVATVFNGADSLYDVSPLQALIDRYMTRRVWERLIEAGREGVVEVGFCCVSLQSGRSRIFTTVTHPDVDTLRRALMASACQPVFMPPTLIDGEQWVDGGLRDVNPIEQALVDFSEGLDGVVSITVDTQGPPVANRKFEGTTDILLRTIHLLTDQVGDADLAAGALANVLGKCREVLPPEQYQEILASLPAGLQVRVAPRGLPVVHLEPRQPLPISGLVFNPGDMRKMVRQGFQETLQRFRGQQDVKP